MLSRSRLVAAIACALFWAAPAVAQTNYSWKYSSTDPASSGSWSPSGVPGASDTAVFGAFDGTTLNMPSFSAATSYGGLTLLGPQAFRTATFTGNGKTLTLGTSGTMTSAPFLYRGGFGTVAVLDNLTVNLATGTAFSSGSFEQSAGAVDLSGFSSRFDLQNGSKLRLVDAAGTTNYDLTINGGALLRVNAGTTLTNGLGVNTNPQGAIRFHGGGQLNAQGANGTASTIDLNQISAASGHGLVGVFLGTTVGGTPSVRLNLGNGTSQTGIDRSFRDIATGDVLAAGSGTLEFNFNGTISGFTGSQGLLFLAAGASGVPTTNGVLTEGTSTDTNSPYVILTGAIPSRSGSLGRFATINTSTGEVTAQIGTARTETSLSSVAAN